jgi:hypothetical protein
MTTNQTIDGVPRELAMRLLLGNGSALANARKELRALLDAERCTSCDGSGDLIDLTGEWRGYCVCPAGVALKNRPTAQPQGEPVAWTEADALDFMSVALRHAEYSGLAPSDILEGLRYMAEKGKAAYYAEQPVPVAVAPSCCGSCPGGCVYGLKA